MNFEVGKCYRYTNRSWLALSENYPYMGSSCIVNSNSFIVLEKVGEYRTAIWGIIEVFKVFCNGRIYYNTITEGAKMYYEAL